MARLRLMCGLAGSGKSTYARGLEAEGWVRFSIDKEAWERGFRSAAEVPAEVMKEARARQRTLIEDALDAGRDVVVDYSSWSRAQRDDYRDLGRRHRAVVDVAHLWAPEAEIRRRLAARRAAHPDDFVVDDVLLAAYLSGFQAPAADELDVTTITSDD